MKTFHSNRFLTVVLVIALLTWGVASVALAQNTVPPAPSAQSDLMPLVPCTDAKATSETMNPCVTIATTPTDLVGVWKTYVLANPAFKSTDGMGYIRFSDDGKFFIADTPEDTADVHANYPYGTITMTDGQLTFNVESQTPPGCETGVWQVRKIQLGDYPVALSFIPINDQCAPRQANLSQPALWVGLSN